MITGRAVSALLLHHRRVVVRRAVNYDFAGALDKHRAQQLPAEHENQPWTSPEIRRNPWPLSRN
jgi:hypothetical protein